MELLEQKTSELLDSFLNFKPVTVDESTRFWMIRTKKGYFYHEFITKNFVALAWNIISSETDFSPSSQELLNDSILLNYHEIKRPTLVVNKCKSFINEIKPNDILVIPSEGSKYITFAYAGEYYEESSKTYELEQNIIQRIENKEVLINEISCPYKKRRRIVPIRTIRGDVVNYHLYKAISSYHGISNLDSYKTIILDHIYNCYSFNNMTRIVFHVTKTEAITSKEFSGFLYGINSILSASGIDEHNISTQASVHSEGDIVFTILKEGITFLSNHYIWFIAIAAILGGGKFLSVELPGLPKIIKDFMSIKSEKEVQEANLKGLQLENYKKALELKEKMLADNVSVSELENILHHLETVSECSSSMQIVPLSNDVSPSITIVSEAFETDDEEEMS